MTPAASSPRSGNQRALFTSDLALPGRRQGKVRDIYELPGDPPRLLVMASDRISAFDVVLPNPVPGKGCLLTEIAAWWLRWIEREGLCRTHLISTDADDLPESAFQGETTREDCAGRVTIGRACRVLPVECVVRGYLEGSGWRDYQTTGAVCGIKLPAGLRRCDKLPEPVFTPATKAEQGEHDENISIEQAGEIVGAERMAWLRDRSLAIYNAADAYARERGLILADTKFEFGLPLDKDGNVADDEPIVIDEALTPDSSRFWAVDDYEPGRAQKSFDKQYVREHLQGLVDRGEWDKTDPGPELPESVIEGTVARYREALERLTG